MAKFPGSQTRPLVAWTRLVNPDMNGYTGIMRLINRRGGGTPINRCKPASVTMG